MLESSGRRKRSASVNDISSKPSKSAGKVKSNSNKGGTISNIKDQITKKSLDEINNFIGSKSSTKRTFHSDNVFEGSVDIPEICLQYLHKQCSEDLCKYLHCPNTYHWQLFSLTKYRWLNLLKSDSERIEEDFRDYKKSWTEFKSSAEDSPETSAKYFRGMFGSCRLIVSFEDMSLKCYKEESSMIKQYQVRRVSTPSTAVSSDMYATEWAWYFLFRNKDQTQWLTYGGKNSPITSEDIELEINTTSELTLAFPEYKYEIDLLTMKEKNLQSGIVRPVRKRPLGKSVNGKTFHPLKLNVPGNWIVMAAEDPFLLHTLDGDSREFLEVRKNLETSLGRLVKKIEIQRVQNKYMWETFEIRRAVMSSMLQKEEEDLERIAFRGIRKDDIHQILRHNLNFQSSSSQKSNLKPLKLFCSAKSLDQDVTSSGRSKVLCRVRVIVGTMTTYQPKVRHLPLNSETNCQYDTAVDDERQPTMYVKYNEAEYYPEYIIRFK